MINLGNHRFILKYGNVMLQIEINKTNKEV